MHASKMSSTLILAPLGLTMPSYMLYHDYDSCKTDAKKDVEILNRPVRLRRVVEFGKEGFVYNLVPKDEAKHFGEDLKGELIRPMVES